LQIQPAALSGFQHLNGGVEAATASAQGALVAQMDHAGLGFVDLAASGAMQWFWIAAAILAAGAVMGAVRLSQDI
jgi:hypothetical protein